jgi:NAD(P)-dependent dehydrogenase (short-subunit alcohol dehydrogenase family)
MSTRLQDKVAVVTGSAAGIGQAVAELFAEEGAKVVGADINLDEGKKIVGAICSKGGAAHFVHADISKPDDDRKISEEAVKAFGGIDILVNNAATFVLKGFDATPEEWQRSLSTNIVGTALVTKYAIEHMKKRGGAIVNLASISSFVAQPDFFAYSATKAAILQMTRNMALDLGPHKIRVNCVCPGTILTAATYRHMKNTGLTFEKFDAEEGAKTFLGRIGQAREAAFAVLFLASDESSYITGTSLMVDGGYTAQ